MSKKIRPPTEHDLEIWRNVNQDLMDWLYSGLTGKFQLRGHQVVGRWSKNSRKNASSRSDADTGTIFFTGSRIIKTISVWILNINIQPLFNQDMRMLRLLVGMPINCLLLIIRQTRCFPYITLNT